MSILLNMATGTIAILFLITVGIIFWAIERGYYNFFYRQVHVESKLAAHLLAILGTIMLLFAIYYIGAGITGV